MNESLLILLMILLLGGSFLASALEIAFFSLSSLTVKAYSTSQDARKNLIADLLQKPRELFVTLFIVNISVNILLQNTTSAYFGSESSWLYVVGLPLALVIFFGEVFPKHLAMSHNQRIAYTLAPLMRWITLFLRYPCKVVMAITVPISRILFFFLKEERPFSKEEVEHVLKVSHQHGAIDKEEGKLVRGFLDLQDTQVKELMQPREDILFYDINKPLSKLKFLFCEEECTRIPVCDKNIESLYGIITANDFFLNQPDIQAPSDLIRYLKKPFFIPENTPVKKLIRHFDEQQAVLALVVDEYGSISGLLTREDLVEVVIGDISDRRDEKELYTRASKSVLIASGKLELEVLEELFGVELESPNNMVTLSGWLTEQLGDIPSSGTSYETTDFLFQILSATPKRIERVYVRKKETER